MSGGLWLHRHIWTRSADGASRLQQPRTLLAYTDLPCGLNPGAACSTNRSAIRAIDIRRMMRGTGISSALVAAAKHEAARHDFSLPRAYRTRRVRAHRRRQLPPARPHVSRIHGGRRCDIQRLRASVGRRPRIASSRRHFARTSARPSLFARDTAADLGYRSRVAQSRRSRVDARCCTRKRGTRAHVLRNASLAQRTMRKPCSRRPVGSLALSPGVATPLGIDGVSRPAAARFRDDGRADQQARERDSRRYPERRRPTAAFRSVFATRGAFSSLIARPWPYRDCRRSSLNVESNPRAQAITLIAEPDPAAGPGQWRTAFARRTGRPGRSSRSDGLPCSPRFSFAARSRLSLLVREGDAGLQLQIVERSCSRRVARALDERRAALRAKLTRRCYAAR